MIVVMRAWLVTLALLLCVGTLVADQIGGRRGRPTRAGGAVLVPGGGGGGGACEDHPCFLFGYADVAAWKTDLANNQLTDFNNFLANYCENAANGGVLDTFSDDREGIYIYAFILLTWQVSGATYHADCTEAAVHAKFDSHFNDFAADTNQFGLSQFFGAIALGYDWGWNYLDGTQRQNGVNALQTMEDEGLAETPWGHVDGRERCMYPASGYVFDGDGIEQTDADARIADWEDYAGNNATGLRALNNAMAGTTGGYPEGWGYWTSETMQGIGFINLLCYEIYRARTGTNVSAAGYNTILEYMPTWWAYLLAPYKIDEGGGFIKFITTKNEASIAKRLDGTWGTDSAHDGFLQFANIAKNYASSNSTQAQLARWLLENQWDANGKLTWGSATADRFGIWTNFIGHNTVTAASPSSLSLPIAKKLESGWVYIRDGWAFDGSNTVVSVQGSPYAWLNKRLWPNQAGSFAIDGAGPLVSHGGVGVHDYQHAYTPWGGNTIMFVTTTETRSGKTVWSKGGPRAPDTFGTIDSTADIAVDGAFDIGGYKTSGCSGGASGGPCGRIDLTDGTAAHTYSYLYGDFTRAYNGPQLSDSENLETVVNFERQIVVMPTGTPGTNPVHVIVYDRTESTGSNVEKRSYLYVAGHATVSTKTMTLSGHGSTDTVSRGGLAGNCPASHNHTRYVGPTLGTISYTGNEGLAAKAYWQPILPASRYVVEVGGPNGSNDMREADGHDAEDPFGCQGGTTEHEDPNNGSTPVAESNGAGFYLWEAPYRYELIAQSASDVQQFLQVITRVETGASAAPTITNVSGTNTTALQINTNRCVVFKTTTGSLTTGDFTLRDTGTFDCLIADVPTSTSETLSWGSNISQIEVIATSTVDTSSPITTTSTANRVFWLRITVTGNGSGANNTISF